jgi:hypothetical protein
MKKLMFQRMIEVEYENDMSNLDVGDNFLMGNAVIAQKSVKEIGQPISYYKVVEKKNKSVLYEIIYDTLEED